MTAWTNDELDRIGGVEELEIASARRDGTLRQPMTIWVVRHGDDLYVRSSTDVHLPGSVGYECGTKATPGRRRRQGRPLRRDGRGQRRVDAEYRSKYGGRYPPTSTQMAGPDARAATIRLLPR
jgi:hypothetical protein